MDWIAPLFGGVTGLLGTGLTFLMEHFKRKQDAATRLEEAIANKELAQLEVQKLQIMQAGNIQQLVAQGETASNLASYENDKASYGNQLPSGTPKSVRVMLGVVDFLRGVIRPGSTIGYGVLFGWLVILAVGTVGAAAIASANATKLIDAAIYLATTTTLWWFGVRNLNKDGK